MTIVVDTSVIAAWVYQDEDNSPKANILMQKISNESVIVPRIFWYEVCNVLLKGERKQRIKSDELEDLIDNIRDLQFDTDEHQNENHILNLGRLYNLTGYDAAYLATAIEKNAMLATYDIALSKAMEKAGVTLFI